jgi:hypothetical protein
MNKKHRWPVKAINLLVALAMVISLVAVLAPTVVAQDPFDADCERIAPPSTCDLELFVRTYSKDIDPQSPTYGDFVPDSTFTPGECFYVNAVVVNVGNETDAEGNITATLEIPLAGVSWAACEGPYVVGNKSTKYNEWDDDPDLTALLKGDMADFWWQVCCAGQTGPTVLKVVADDLNGAGGGCAPVSRTVTVDQGAAPGEADCLYIEIVEAPGWALTGYQHGGQTYDWVQTFPTAYVDTCTNFGIKAIVVNNCASERYVWATIDDLQGWQHATLAPTSPSSGPFPDPTMWDLGWMYPGEMREVAWTVHCDDQGPVEIIIEARSAPGAPSYTDIEYGDHNPYTVHQTGVGDLEVEIIDPVTCTDTCAVCDPVPIIVEVRNNTGERVDSIDVTCVSNSSLLTIADISKDIAFLESGQSGQIQFDGTCTGPGEVRLTGG